jgi:hypothetical protein
MSGPRHPITVVAAALAVQGAVGCGAPAASEGRAPAPSKEDRMAAAKAAVAEAWQDERLWALVRERWWLPRPDEAPMEGKDVARYLRNVHPESQVYALYWRAATRTTAHTAACGTIAINSHLISTDTYLINTVAHENTHYVGLGAGDLGCGGPGRPESRFKDGDYTNVTMPWLVSYAFGDLAECFRGGGGDRTETLACMEHRINGSRRSCRRFEECCAIHKHDETPANVKDIRARSGCAGVACDGGPLGVCPEERDGP